MKELPEAGRPADTARGIKAVRAALLRARLEWAASRGAAAFARVFAPAALYLSAAALADRLFFLDERLRLAGLAACLGWALWRFYSWFFRPLAGLGRERLSAEISSASPALRLHIGPAADLAAAGDGAPDAFAAAHIRQTAELLSRERPALPPSGLRERLPAAGLAGAALLLSALLNGASLARVSMPAAAGPLEDSLRVSPGDASVREGETALIEASWLNGSPGRPVLSLRERGGEWRRREWSECGGGSCRGEAEVGRGGLDYRLEFRGRRTRAYRLDFLPRPGFTALSCEFFPPPYSGLPPSSPGYCPASAELVRGGWIRLEAVPSYAPAGIALSGPGGGRSFFSALPGGRWELALRPSASGTYDAEFSAADGGRLRVGEIMGLELKEDAPPAAALPGAAGGYRGGPVSLLYEAADDIGLASIVVERRVRGLPALDTGYTVYESAPPGERTVFAEELFSLHDVPAGAEVSFTVKARDFNPAGVWSVSRALSVRAGAPSLSGGEGLFRARAALEGLKGMEEAFAAGHDPSSLPGLGRSWRELPALLRSARVTGEEAAPGARAAGEALAGLAAAAGEQAGGKVPERERASGEGDGARVAALSSELRSFLQSASAEADAAAGALFTALAAGALDGAEAAALEMERDLRAAREGGGLKRAKLENLLERINSELSALMKALGDPAAAPPSEGKVYRLPLGSAMDLAAGIAGDLASGDLDAAIEKAGRLLERLSEARRVAAERMEDLAASSPQSRASAEAEALAAAVRELASGQAALLEDTRSRHDLVLARRAAAAAAPLARAASLSAAWLSAAGGVDAASAPVREAAALSAAGLPAEALLKIREAERLLSVSTASGSGPFLENLEAQAAALEEAAAAMSLLEKDDAGFLDSAAGRQGRLASRASELAGRAAAAGESYPSLGPGPASAIRAAAAHMSGAAASLENRDFQGALSAQEAALRELEKGSRELTDYSAAMSAMSRPGGTAGGGHSPRSSGGRARVPGAEGYVPPEELRRRVLESLREPYPEEKKKTVEDYLRGVGR